MCGAGGLAARIVCLLRAPGVATVFGLLTLCFLRFYPTSLVDFIYGTNGNCPDRRNCHLYEFRELSHDPAGIASPPPDPVSVSQSTITPLAIPSTTSSPRPDKEHLSSSPQHNLPNPQTVLHACNPSSNRNAHSYCNRRTDTYHCHDPASEGGGAFIRDQPGGQALITLCQWRDGHDHSKRLSGCQRCYLGACVCNDRRPACEGWILQSLLQTATPLVDWQPRLHLDHARSNGERDRSERHLEQILSSRNLMPIHFGTDGWRAVISGYVYVRQLTNSDTGYCRCDRVRPLG